MYVFERGKNRDSVDEICYKYICKDENRWFVFSYLILAYLWILDEKLHKEQDVISHEYMCLGCDQLFLPFNMEWGHCKPFGTE